MEAKREREVLLPDWSQTDWYHVRDGGRGFKQAKRYRATQSIRFR